MSSFSYGAGRVRSALAALIGVLTLPAWLLTWEQTASAQPACPNPPVPSISESSAPADVCISDGFGGNPIDFFDDFSWRAFIAMVWPAKQGTRGEADPALTLGSPGPLVFETYKAQWEVFHADGSAPAGWNVYDNTNACNVTPAFGGLVLASFSKFSDLGMAGFGKLLGPLAARNQTYVRYLTGMNKSEFDKIQSEQLYLRSNLPAAPNVLTFPDGSIDVKSAWMDMTGVAHPERYYTRQALVGDPSPGGGCSMKTVGLIGLHIVIKSPTRPQWIWSSFEHIDLTPQPGATAPFALHAGDQTPMPANDPLTLTPLIVPPTPFNVTRVKPIHESTQATNAAYQNLLSGSGSIWRFYQLVMTQWPLTPNSPTTPGNPANTFPGTGSDQTTFSNIALETFEQKTIGTGCMACHNITKQQTDFLWVLNTRAFLANVPALLATKTERSQLRDLLLHAHGANTAARKAAPKKRGPSEPK
jgi:hypothetical protein